MCNETVSNAEREKNSTLGFLLLQHLLSPSPVLFSPSASLPPSSSSSLPSLLVIIVVVCYAVYVRSSIHLLDIPFAHRLFYWMVARLKFRICLNVVPTSAPYIIYRQIHTFTHTHQMGVFEFGVLQMDEQQMNSIVQFYEAAMHFIWPELMSLCAKIAYILLILIIHVLFFFFLGS